MDVGIELPRWTFMHAKKLAVDALPLLWDLDLSAVSHDANSMQRATL